MLLNVSDAVPNKGGSVFGVVWVSARLISRFGKPVYLSKTAISLTQSISLGQKKGKIETDKSQNQVATKRTIGDSGARWITMAAILAAEA